MTRSLIAYFLALLAASSLRAQSGPSARLEPLTDEVSVSAGETSDHALVSPKAVVLGEKEFLVSWDVSYTQYSGSQLIDFGSAISARKVSLAGQPVGSVLPLEPFQRRSSQTFHSLAADASGRFAMLWQELNTRALLLRRFAADGSRLGTQRLKPNAGDNGFPYLVNRPLAMDRSGRIVAAWRRVVERLDFPENEIWMQLFDSTGAPHGRSFEIPRRQNKVEPALAVAGSKIVLAYSQNNSVFVQLFDFDGRPLGRETAVVGGATFQYDPVITANAEGRFVVAWSNGRAIQARLFDPAGKKIGPVIQISTRRRFADSSQHAAMDAQGNFVVVWQGREGNDLPQDVRARLFNRDGVPQGSDLVVASDLDPQGFSDGISTVAVTSAGTFLIVWRTFSLEDTEFLHRIQARLYSIVRDDE